MRPSLISNTVEACSDRSRKRRRLDDLRTRGPPPPLTLSNVQCANGEAVCYGMIVGLPVLSHPHSTILEPYDVTRVNVHKDRTLRLRNDYQIAGSLSDEIFHMLEKLANGNIECQLSLVLSDTGVQTRKKDCLLDVIFYGRKQSADAFGFYMEQYGYSLQDPDDCDHNVPYINPHRLSSMFDDPPMTYDIQNTKNPLIETFTKAAIEAVANFKTLETLEQAATPSALATELQLQVSHREPWYYINEICRHQKEALSFFRRRELGLGSTDVDYGVWQARGNPGNTGVFLNTITDQETASKPPVWRGGILADEMGLGKTLSMIALIASDKDVLSRRNLPTKRIRNIVTAHPTLVIVPHNVLSGWEFQLQRHVKAGRLTWAKHQGKDRIYFERRAKLPDIILTTYQTVEAEYRRANGSSGNLACIKWKRIILDEAHIIRNWKTSTAKGISSLTAVSRWAISGTPLQNGLQDLLGLFKFLQFQPYNNARAFEEDIIGSTVNSKLEDSVKRLTRLLSCTMIRRTKATTRIMLPPKSEKVIRLRFTASEQAHYQRVERPASPIPENEAAKTHISGSAWLSALQQIHLLRSVCNLGTAAPLSRPILSLSTLFADDSGLQALSTRLLMGDGSCQHCLAIFDPDSKTQSDDGSADVAYYSICYKLFCASCAKLFELLTPKPCECGASKNKCTLQPIPVQHSTPESTPTSDSYVSVHRTKLSTYFSTKVKALLLDIVDHLNEKSVVFSFWTSSLDMVESALRYAEIEYVRIDGKVPTSSRTQLLEKYRNDSNVRVMLITTSCGAVGIDLTAATRAYLLEPQWNPTVEEQAMARIHRIGQTRPVTTIKYIMEDTIEEHILDVVQDRKKLLTSMLLPAAKQRTDEN